METTRSRVIALKKAHPELGTPEIAAAVGVSKCRVWQIFVEAGIVTPGLRMPRETRAGEQRKKLAPPPKPEIRPHMMPGLTIEMLTGPRAPRAKLKMA